MDDKKKTIQSEQILNAAFKCISEQGYANVSLRSIADEAGVVLSQLNYYFKDKEGLFIAVIEMLIQKYLQEVEEELKKGNSAQEKVSYLINWFQGILKYNPELFKLLYNCIDMAIWSTSFRDLMSNLFKDMAALIESQIFGDYSVTEKFQDYTSNALSRIYLGAIFGTAVQVILAPAEENLVESLNAIQIIFE